MSPQSVFHALPRGIAAYAGTDLTERDSTVVFLDWDDTLFPSTSDDPDPLRRRMQFFFKILQFFGGLVECRMSSKVRNALIVFSPERAL